MTETQNIQNLITSTLEAKTTAELLEMHLITSTETDETSRQLNARIADTITARLGLDDAIENIMFGDDENIYEGTYHEAILTAMNTVNA